MDPLANTHDLPSVFENVYLDHDRVISNLIASGETSLPRILAIVERVLHSGRKEPYDSGWVFKNHYYDPPPHDALLTSWVHRLSVREFLHRSIPPECDMIVEIGGGWGMNLFNLWLGGAAPEAEYVMLEPAEAGRTLCEKIAPFAPIKLRTGSCDLSAIDLTEITASSRNAFVFTCYAIESVRFLPDDFFDRLIASPAISGGAHIEPGAWQEDASSEINVRARDYDLKVRRNENFFPLLRRASRQGRIDIAEIVINNHSTNQNGPVSLVHWTRGDGRPAIDHEIAELRALITDGRRIYLIGNEANIEGLTPDQFARMLNHLDILGAEIAQEAERQARG